MPLGDQHDPCRVCRDPEVDQVIPRRLGWPVSTAVQARASGAVQLLLTPRWSPEVPWSRAGRLRGEARQPLGPGVKGPPGWVTHPGGSASLLPPVSHPRLYYQNRPAHVATWQKQELMIVLSHSVWGHLLQGSC